MLVFRDAAARAAENAERKRLVEDQAEAVLEFQVDLFGDKMVSMAVLSGFSTPGVFARAKGRTHYFGQIDHVAHILEQTLP